MCRLFFFIVVLIFALPAILSAQEHKYLNHLNSGIEYYNSNELESAIIAFENARRLMKKTRFRNSIDYLNLCLYLSLAYNNVGRISESLETISIADKLFERNLLKKENYPDEYSNMKFIFGMILKNARDFKKSKYYFERAIELYENQYGADSELFYLANINLAELFTEADELEKAETLYFKFLDYCENTYGKYSTQYTQLISAIGYNLYMKGDYQKADSFLLEAKSYLDSLGKDVSADYAFITSTIADINRIRGNLQIAKEQFEEVVKIYGEIDHPNLTTAKINLAHVYLDMDSLHQAERLMLDAMKVYELRFGKESSYYGILINQIGLMYLNGGLAVDAEVFFLSALNILEKSLGTNHSSYITCLINLGSSYIEQSKYQEAEEIFIYVKDTRERTFGASSLKYINAIEHLIILYYRWKQYEKSIDYYMEYGKNVYNYLSDLTFLSENERMAFYSYRFMDDGLLASMILELNNFKEYSSKWFDYTVLFKSYLLNINAAIRNSILNSNDIQVVEQFKKWQEERSLLYNHTGLSNTEANKEKINELVKRNEYSEKMLYKALGISLNSLKQIYTWVDICNNLEEDEAAIEIVRFVYNNSDSIVYAALVITKHTIDYPKVIILPFGRNLERDKLEEYYFCIENKLETAYSYSAYLEPILNSNHLDGITKIYFSPDGVYHKIGLQSLMIRGTEKYVKDKYDIRIISSTREIIKRQKVKYLNNQIAYLFADPEINNLGLNISNQGLGKENYTDENSRFNNNGLTPSLAGTKLEVVNIKTLLESYSIMGKVYIGAEASEKGIKLIAQPKILHIATHGYFLSSTEMPDYTFNGLGDVNRLNASMLNSGLLLASSVNLSHDSIYDKKAEDGILTAYEIQGMNLLNTELVVLSACETGKGELLNGEGVFGLQRAVRIAGAESILMSLWKVDDDATQLFMTTFYEAWLKTGSKRRGLKNAQDAVQTIYPEPYYWGAFVLIGQD